MNLFANHNFDGGSAEHSIVDNIPSGFRQQGMARGSERGKVGHSGAGYQPALAFRGQTEDVTNPAEDHFFEFRGDGRHHAKSNVLIPGTGEPISSSMETTSAGSVERSGNGSSNLESAASAFSLGATWRSAMFWM